MTTLTAATIRASITAIRYELAPSAIDAMGLDTDAALVVFGDALLEVYPNASVTVRRANIDGSTMDATGEIDGEGIALVRRHFGGTTVATGLDVSVDAERSIAADDQDVWERACKLAAERA